MSGSDVRQLVRNRYREAAQNVRRGACGGPSGPVSSGLHSKVMSAFARAVRPAGEARRERPGQRTGRAS